MNIVKKFLLGKEQYENFEKVKQLPLDQPENLQKTIKTMLGFEHKDSSIKSVLHDIEMFESFDNSNDIVFKNLDKTKLIGSKMFLKEILSHPTDDIKVLNKRKAIIKDLIRRFDDEELMDILKEKEDILDWVYSMSKEDLHSLYNMVYFTSFITRPLNKHSIALYSSNFYKILISPTLGIISPIAYFIIPYLILRYKFKFDMSLYTYIKTMFNSIFIANQILPPKIRIINNITYVSSLIFYFQGILNSVEISKAINSISNVLSSRMNDVVRFINTSEELLESYWDSSYPEIFFGEKDSSAPLSFNKYADVRIQDYSIFSNFGIQLHNYKFFDKSAYVDMIRRIYQLDSILSVARLYKSTTDGFSFARYKIGCEVPKISLRGVYHPSIKNPVKNDVQFSNVIITGPNAGGKSTLIKSVLISIILSQTITISNCSYINITPFAYINSQLNVPDCKGKESLFEAEMHRSKANLDKLVELNGKFSIMIMDEIFNSTNPVEGISGAYAIMKKISSYRSNIMIFTTHYGYLTRLSKECNFRNMKMCVDIASNGDISFPFKLQHGVSRQYIALDLLKLNGFDEELIDYALGIKKQFV